MLLAVMAVSLGGSRHFEKRPAPANAGAGAVRESREGSVNPCGMNSLQYLLVEMT
jgi:hypothetical protein